VFVCHGILVVVVLSVFFLQCRCCLSCAVYRLSLYYFPFLNLLIQLAIHLDFKSYNMILFHWDVVLAYEFAVFFHLFCFLSILQVSSLFFISVILLCSRRTILHCLIVFYLFYIVLLLFYLFYILSLFYLFYIV